MLEPALHWPGALEAEESPAAAVVAAKPAHCPAVVAEAEAAIQRHLQRREHQRREREHMPQLRRPQPRQDGGVAAGAVRERGVYSQDLANHERIQMFAQVKFAIL